MKLSPALAYLASSPWAMEFGLFGRLSEIVAAHAAGERIDTDAVAALKSAAGADAQPSEPGIQWIGRTAVVPVRGAVARYASSVNGFCQPQGRSAEAIQSDLMTAAERGAERIIMRMDSPGGEVAGTAETAAMVRHISASGIPVIAYVDGRVASAAYWIASQADEIVASSDTAEVGSIGVAMTVSGGSGRQTVITSAPGKSGHPLNDAHLANARAIVTDLATAFADAVAAGRSMTADQVAALATGEVWTAIRAMELNLVDRIATWSELIGNTAADTSADPVRRKAIAERLAATVTITTPAARATAADDPSPPLAAASNAQESTMDAKFLAALTALSALLPTHAEALAAEAAKPGATLASLEAFAAPLKAKLQDEAHAKALAEVQAKLTAAEAERDAAKAAQAKAEAKAAHAVGGTDPGPDDQSETVQPKRSAMSADDKGAYVAKHGQAAYQALPA